MKIAKIMRMMKAHGSVILYQKQVTGADGMEYIGPQWISCGTACYCLAGLPRIANAEEFFVAYDVNEKKREKFYFRMEEMPEWLNIQRWESKSLEAQPVGLTVDWRGKAFTAFSYEGVKTLFIQRRYLEPFGGEDDEYIEYMVRYIEGIASVPVPVLVIYDGMNLQAVIPPVRFNDSPDSVELGSALNDFTTELWREVDQYRRTKEQAQAQVSILDMDGDDEEAI